MWDVGISTLSDSYYGLVCYSLRAHRLSGDIWGIGPYIADYPEQALLVCIESSCDVARVAASAR
jgi:hypothetical protein